MSPTSPKDMNTSPHQTMTSGINDETTVSKTHNENNLSTKNETTDFVNTSPLMS